MNVAFLPGMALVVYDPQYRLVIDVVPCEDGDAQERSLIQELHSTIEPSDLWIADRNFRTTSFLATLNSIQAAFIMRQHGSLPFTLAGERRRVGATSTGTVYEQAMSIPTSDGQTLPARRVTVQLHEATRDGDQELHLTTNLPRRISAIEVADLYRGRWRIETAFQGLARNLQGEIQALGYPRAALFGFCMALVTCNLLSIVTIAVAATRGAEAARNLSTYYIALEVNGMGKGMCILLNDDFWPNTFAYLTPLQMARQLKKLAANRDMALCRKASWKPRKGPRLKMNK